MFGASLLSAGVCWLVFRADRLTMALSLLPVVFGGLLFLGLALAVPGLVGRRPARVEAWTLPTVFLSSVAGAKLVNEGGRAPLVVIGDAFRSDFLWLQPWFLGLVWLLMVGWLSAAWRRA